MIKEVASKFLADCVLRTSRDISSENSKIICLAKNIAAYPIKTLATFIFAPFLILRVAAKVKNPIRRSIAIFGVIASVAASYLTATALGTFLGAIFIGSKIGWISTIGFIIGTTVSVYMSVLISVISFNAVSFFFLKASSQEIAEYLERVSGEEGGQENT